MTANVGSSVVSYGIGVQNRYSAFLDDDDNFALASIQASLPKQLSLEGKKKATQKTNAKINLKSKQDYQTKSNQASNAQKSSTKNEASRQQQVHNVVQQQQGGLDQQMNKQSNNKQSIGYQGDASLNGYNRYQRNTYATSTQSQSSGYMNKENKTEASNALSDSSGKPNPKAPRDARFHNRPRQIFRDDEKQLQTVQDFNQAGTLNGISVEDEKRRRQQKRVNDLRHKDPEKREARRHQANKVGDEETQDGQKLDGNFNQSDKPDEPSYRSRGNSRLPRREGERFDGAPRGFRGGIRGRGPRREGEEASSGDAGRLDASDKRRYDGDRLNRTRNGFVRGSEPRGYNRSDDISRNLDRQKPIPNISDKLDFPSLAS